MKNSYGTDGNIYALDKYYQRQDQLDEGWDNFKDSFEYDYQCDVALGDILQDEETIWESLGPDAVQGDTKKVSSLICLYILSKKDEQLGRLLRTLAESYHKDRVEQLVEERWTANQ